MMLNDTAASASIPEQCAYPSTMITPFLFSYCPFHRFNSIFCFALLDLDTNECRCPHESQGVLKENSGMTNRAEKTEKQIAMTPGMRI